MSKARNMARMGQDTSAGYTGAFDMPAGTTAERPASAGIGWTRLNTDTGSVEVYDGTNWNAVTRPFISSVTGTIYAGAASNLVIAGQNFTSTITVRFLEGGSTVADVSGVTVTGGSATVAVPAAVYGQTAGDSIEVKMLNNDGTLSANGITKTVEALPTGGTTATYTDGSTTYRSHTFTSSGNFVAPSGFSKTCDALIVAGGGAGGCWHAGGGGAGGMITHSPSVSAGTYPVVIGAGGAGGTTSVGTNGGDSSVFSQTAIGGGRGGNYATTPPASGGSGAGGNGTTNSSTYWDPAAGTSGQGNAGGRGNGDHNGGGGGGKGATGVAATSSPAVAGNGGIGAINTYKDGTNIYYAGGGGGGSWSGTQGTGGTGGGGNGSYNGNTNPPTPGSVNTGGGGGGAGSQGNVTSYAAQTSGGSGIVVIRYAL